MTAHRCAMSGCDHDATGIFCSDCYFRLPAKDAKWLVRLQIMIARSDDAELKTHLREQLHGYTQQAIRDLTARMEVRETLIDRHLRIRDRDRLPGWADAPASTVSENAVTPAERSVFVREAGPSGLDGEPR